MSGVERGAQGGHKLGTHAHLVAARAHEAPAARLALPERLPGRHVRAVAQIFKSEATVVLALVLRVVVDARPWVGRIGVVTACAKWGTERLSIMREHSTYVSNKRFVRDEHELHENSRPFPVRGLEFAGFIDALEVGEQVAKSAGEDGVVLRLAGLLIK